MRPLQGIGLCNLFPPDSDSNISPSGDSAVGFYFFHPPGGWSTNSSFSFPGIHFMTYHFQLPPSLLAMCPANIFHFLATYLQSHIPVFFYKTVFLHLWYFIIPISTLSITIWLVERALSCSCVGARVCAPYVTTGIVQLSKILSFNSVLILLL